ncbi:MAG: adenylate/guanylate cyclase domain-containing protein [Candidatus Eremiobacteraeota bacterium]|nr:adenylate/guanylate cyclase domain-containing protein [Candidatus Eremiobacteraeota bacterium]
MDGLIALLTLTLLLAAALAFYAVTILRRYLTERDEHRRVRALFTRYVPPPVVDELLARKDPRLFQARQYYATILSCRIRNFALLAEELSAEETLAYLNEFYAVVGKAVQRHRGIIESLRGETVTAVFGVLVEEHFQEERALRAALDIARMMKAMEAQWSSQGRKALHVGIGVNSGTIVAGDTGYQQRREFAIVGNPAQVAASLESASEELNAGILASEATFDVVRELFVGVPASSLPLRGLKRLHSAYVIRGLSRRAGSEGAISLPTRESIARTVLREEEAATLYEPIESPATTARVDERIASNPPARSERFGAPVPLRAEPVRFSQLDDDRPVLPDPPLVTGTYEDDQGPPVQLPP